MRLLFASTQGAGHFGPLIPFIDAALAGGHEALIVGPPTLKARGYPFRAGASPPDEVLGPLWSRMPSLPPGQGDVIVVGVIFARLNVDAMLPALSDAIEEWRPDVVVREASEFASAVAADLHGVPHVRVAFGRRHDRGDVARDRRARCSTSGDPASRSGSPNRRT